MCHIFLQVWVRRIFHKFKLADIYTNVDLQFFSAKLNQKYIPYFLANIAKHIFYKKSLGALLLISIYIKENLRNC